MKRISFNRSLFILWILLLEVHAVQAQVIDNKGNRNQTYPLVTETNPAVVEMINQVDTMNLYNTIAWMQQYIRDASSPEALLKLPSRPI